MNDSFTNTADNSNNAAGLFVTEVSPGGNTGDSIAEYAAAAFDRAYNQSYQVPFCLSWNNGTGYLNNAVEDDGINFSQKDLVSFVDNHGRMAIAMKKDDLRVVIFELFPNRAIGVFVMNGNRSLRSGNRAVCSNARVRRELKHSSNGRKRNQLGFG